MSVVSKQGNEEKLVHSLYSESNKKKWQKGKKSEVGWEGERLSPVDSHCHYTILEVLALSIAKIQSCLFV